MPGTTETPKSETNETLEQKSARELAFYRATVARIVAYDNSPAARQLQSDRAARRGESRPASEGPGTTSNPT